MTIAKSVSIDDSTWDMIKKFRGGDDGNTSKAFNDLIVAGYECIEKHKREKKDE